MAITSADIQNQSFKIERRGYDVDEVDVFLERVASEIDDLNDEIAHLRAQASEASAARTEIISQPEVVRAVKTRSKPSFLIAADKRVVLTSRIFPSDASLVNSWV